LASATCPRIGRFKGSTPIDADVRVSAPLATQFRSAFGLDVPDRLIALADEVIE